jgi:pimeloyl-ACP methyl ester carboxylesterase
MSNLRDNAHKRIVWAGAKGEKTPLSVVYLHGFSASSEEIRPVPDLVAQALGANLYFTRLTGHGADGAAMADATVNAWVTDLAEAMAIGRRLGTRVVLIGTSTGATLAALAAAEPELRLDLAGLVLISPNFRAAGIGGRMIEWPYVRTWGPWFVGAERSFEPRSPGHAANWTTSYPATVLATLGALTHYVRGLDFAAMTVPAMFFVSNNDQVVDTAVARRIAARWGAPSELVPVTMGPQDDPSGHVLAGDILSPGKTAPVVERIVTWVRRLPEG